MSSTFLEIADPQCSAEDFDGEIVAINLETGVYFSIRETGAAIWHDLVAGHTVESLVALAGPNAVLAAGIESFIADLQNNGLLRPATLPAAQAPAAPMRTALTSDTVAPTLESFGDMQSLLLLDPVHEVDENIGWPKRSEE